MEYLSDIYCPGYHGTDPQHVITCNVTQDNTDPIRAYDYNIVMFGRRLDPRVVEVRTATDPPLRASFIQDIFWLPIPWSGIWVELVDAQNNVLSTAPYDQMCTEEIPPTTVVPAGR